MEKIRFNTIPEAIEDIKAGKMIIVVDDEDRENEGDFLMAGEKATTEAINFMVKEIYSKRQFPVHTKQKQR